MRLRTTMTGRGWDRSWRRTAGRPAARGARQARPAAVPQLSPRRRRWVILSRRTPAGRHLRTGAGGRAQRRDDRPNAGAMEVRRADGAV